MAILDGRDLSTCRRFTGYLADRSICTSLVELDEAHQRLWIRLASVTRFSVSLDKSAVDLLIETLEGPGACAVRCTHERGQRLLGADPVTEPGVVPHSDRRTQGRPTRLYLHLDEPGGDEHSGVDHSRDRIDVTLPEPAVTALVAHLRSCRASMV